MKRFIVLLVICLLIVGAGLAQKESKPPITKEVLQQRLGQLQQAREQAIANVNALNGAIQECTYWIDQIEAAEKPPVKIEEKKPEKVKSDASLH